MKLAWRELVRKPGRFTMAGVILTLIALLLMFLGGLLDGLLASSTGAYRVQDADRIVYSDTSKDSLVRSRIEPDVRAQVEDAVGDGEVGGFGSIQLGARMDGRGVRDLIPVSYTHLVQWNFEKFLVTPGGEVVRFRPGVVPEDPAIVSAIEANLPA